MKMNENATADEIPDFFLLERMRDISILRLGKNFLFETIKG